MINCASSLTTPCTTGPLTAQMPFACSEWDISVGRSTLNSHKAEQRIISITPEQPLTPYEQVRKVYETEPCRRSFEEDLHLHLQTGYVFSTPTLFLMGRPVRRKAPTRWIVDPHHVFQNPDAWLIYLAAGNMAEFFEKEPYELPWVGWEKRNVLRFYPMASIKGKLCSQHKMKQSCQ